MPVTAVNENSGQPWIVRVRDGKAEKVNVTLGLRDDQTERVEIAVGRAGGRHALAVAGHHAGASLKDSQAAATEPRGRGLQPSRRNRASAS